MRKALSILSQEGYIVAEHGRGTFCSQRMGHLKQSKNIAVITTYISDYIFSQADPGDGPGAHRKRLQHYLKEYGEQQDERGESAGRYPDQGH